MSDPNIFDRQGNGPSIRAGLGAICVMFLALAIWQSKATSQSAHPVEADAGLSAPRSIAQQPKRRPIEPGRWSHAFEGYNLNQMAAQRPGP